jgi:hypothetical protein
MMALTSYRAKYSLENLGWRERAARRQRGHCPGSSLGLVVGNALLVRKSSTE